MTVLQGRFAKLLSIVLLVQLFAYYLEARRADYIPNVAPLDTFPTHVGDWVLLRDIPLEKDVIDVLKSDDTLQRMYINPRTNQYAWLFIAFFKTQRTGQSPHSPKNCLPGSGYEPLLNDRAMLEVPGEAKPIKVNRYVVEKGTDKDAVLYWYQSHGRIVADEFAAKFWSVADAMRYHRSDTALVRISVPVAGNDTDTAINAAYDFTRTIFPPLLKQLPQ